MGTVTGVRSAKASPVLCVDLDGTLIRGDVLWECVLVLLKTRPLTLFLIPFWLLSGKAFVKRQLATRTNLNPADLPYRPEVIELVRNEKSLGRRIALTTAADQGLADNISSYLGLFDEVHGSNGQLNLKGATKAAFLAHRYQGTGFEYVGDSTADVDVWRNSQGAYVVGTEARANQAAAVTEIRVTFLEPELSFRTSFRTTCRTWFNAIRGHHWAKNLLLFLPLILSHNLEAGALLRTTAAFVLYGLCASGLYVVNDLLDLHSDREHPWKKKRPFAAGEISIPEGLVASTILLGVAIGLGFTLAIEFGLLLVGYAALTMSYSLYFKKIALLDVFILSGFYTFRIVAGALISATPLSQWFLAFSTFLFLSLAMAKRYSELLNAGTLIRKGKSGRGYRAGDREVLLALGVGSSFSAVVIFSLYVHSPEVRLLYSSPEFLFLLCPVVLYWLSRTWLLAHRGELKEDPVTLAMRDPVSYAAALVCAIVIAASIIHVNW
jgi:4-hydroxybenzoate polyprenyltransferase